MGTDNTPTVLVSNAAGSKDLVLYPPLDTYGALCNLPSTDVSFVGNGPDGPLLIGVEVKSLSDLLSSVDCGRLQATQIPKLLESHNICWLLIYGEYRCTSDGKLEEYKLVNKSKISPTVRPYYKWCPVTVGQRREVPYGYLVSFLTGITDLGIHYDHVHDIAESAQWIGALARRWNKPYNAHASFRTFDRSRSSMPLRPDLSRDTLADAAVYAALPGIGWDRAISLAQAFSCVDAFVAATPSSLAEVTTVSSNGRTTRLGPVLASSLHSMLHRGTPNTPANSLSKKSP